MQSAVFTSDRRIEVVDSPIPQPQPGTTLVKVAAAGVCGTELHFLDGMLDPGETPRILGHEVAGTVIRGSDRYDAGARVAIYNVAHCGSCSYCRSGRERLCSNSKGMIGFTLDGGFAEFLAAPEANLVSIPDDVSFDTAATLACSGMTAVHAVRRAGIGLGDLVVVNGIGGVGLMVINVATLAGASVVAIGDHHDKLRMAEDAGASTTLLVEDDYSDLGPRLHEMSIGQPIAVFETVGSAQSIQAGIRLLAADGSFVQIGYTSDHIDIHPSLLIRNELRIISSAAGSKRDLETAIALAGAGRLHARTTLVSGLGGLRPTLQAMRERRTLGRSVIVFEDRESD